MALVAGLLASSVGCYRDLDYSNIKCDITATPACPDGLMCSAGLCVKAPEVIDGSADETGTPSSLDAASVDQGGAIDQVVVPDIVGTEAQPSVDVAPTVDTTLDTSMDMPDDIATGIDGIIGGIEDAPQLNLDAGLLDSESAMVDASDTGTVDVGGIDAEWHPVEEFTIPTKNTNPCALAASPDGYLWFCECDGKAMGRISISGEIKEYPLSTGCDGYGIVAGPDKNIWFTEGYNIGRLDPGTGDVKDFPVSESSQAPTSLTFGPDNNLWFGVAPYAQVGTMTTSGEITFYRTTTSSPSHSNMLVSSGYLWYANGSGISRMDIDGNETVFKISSGSLTYSTLGGDGRIWFTYADIFHEGVNGNPGYIGTMTTSGQYSQYSVPSPLEGVSGSIVGAADGNVWFLDQNTLVRMLPNGSVTSFEAASSDRHVNYPAAGPDGNLWFIDTPNSQLTNSTIDKIGRMRL
jgi:virginiamycin B lyase